MLTVIYARYRKIGPYAQCNYAECRYADFLYAECRGALQIA
jgi:hypothetical protein